MIICDKSRRHVVTSSVYALVKARIYSDLSILLCDSFTPVDSNLMSSCCTKLNKIGVVLCRSSPHLKFMRFFAFVGHGNTKKKRVPKGLFVDPSATQMSGPKQQQTLQEFGKPGHHVLVSTSIGEEGINIPTCEFVVRYTPTVSGTVRVQSRGRSRMEGGQYLNIVEPESDEHRLLIKSVMEEQQMKKVLKLLPSGS